MIKFTLEFEVTSSVTNNDINSILHEIADQTYFARNTKAKPAKNLKSFTCYLDKDDIVVNYGVIEVDNTVPA